MNKTMLFKLHYSPSTICKELIENTRNKKINWVSYEKFIDYLDLQGIAYDDIRWFHTYLRHVQSVRFYPNFCESYFTFYEERLFGISRSKYSREFRMDFTSSFDSSSIWRGIIDSQLSFSKLHSLVHIINFDDTADECQSLLLATGCIHA